jgi:hypothetical protein
VNLIERYRAINQRTLTLADKSETLLQLLKLSHSNEQHIKQALSELVAGMLEFRHAVSDGSYHRQQRALEKIQELHSNYPQALPGFEQTLRFMHNRSKLFARPLPATIRELIQLLAPQLQLKIGETQYAFLNSLGIKFDVGCKNRRYRNNLSQSQLVKNKQAALEYYQQQLFPRIAAVTAQPLREHVLNRLVKFNYLVNFSLRDKVATLLTVDELVEMISPWCEEIGITSAAEKKLMVEHTLYLNVHRQHFHAHKALLKVSSGVVGSLSGFLLSVLLVGIIEVAMSLVSYSNNHPSFKLEDRFGISLIIYIVALLVTALLYYPCAIAAVVPLCWRLMHRTGKPLYQAVEAGDGLQQTTNSFKAMLARLHLSFPELVLNPSLNDEVYRLVCRSSKFKLAIKFNQKREEQAAWEILFTNPQAISKQESYNQVFNSESARGLINQCSLDYNSISAHIREDKHLNASCPISLQEFSATSQVIALKLSNGASCLYDASALKQWLTKYCPDNPHEPTTRGRPWFIRPDELIQG